MEPRARDLIVFAKLRAQIEYAWERSPFYRQLWSDGDVSPDDLQELWTSPSSRS